MAISQSFGAFIGILSIILTIFVFWDAMRAERRFHADAAQQAEKPQEESTRVDDSSAIDANVPKR